MTAFVDITNNEIDQDSPVTQPLMVALRDNPVAITEGAAGAPRISTAAMVAPTAGSNIIAKLSAGIVSNNQTVKKEIDPVRVLVGGTVTMSAAVYGAAGTFELWKNDAVVYSSPINSSLITHTFDVSVVLGDRLAMSIRATQYGSLVYIKDAFIMSGTQNFAVA